MSRCKRSKITQDKRVKRRLVSDLRTLVCRDRESDTTRRNIRRHEGRGKQVPIDWVGPDLPLGERYSTTGPRRIGVLTCVFRTTDARNSDN